MPVHKPKPTKAEQVFSRDVSAHLQGKRAPSQHSVPLIEAMNEPLLWENPASSEDICGGGREDI